MKRISSWIQNTELINLCEWKPPCCPKCNMWWRAQCSVPQQLKYFFVDASRIIGCSCVVWEVGNWNKDAKLREGDRQTAKWRMGKEHSQPPSRNTTIRNAGWTVSHCARRSRKSETDVGRKDACNILQENKVSAEMMRHNTAAPHSKVQMQHPPPSNAYVTRHDEISQRCGRGWWEGQKLFQWPRQTVCCSALPQTVW